MTPDCMLTEAYRTVASPSSLSADVPGKLLIGHAQHTDAVVGWMYYGKDNKAVM